MQSDNHKTLCETCMTIKPWHAFSHCGLPDKCDTCARFGMQEEWQAAYDRASKGIHIPMDRRRG